MTDPEDPYMDAWWPPGHNLGWEHTLFQLAYEFLRETDASDGGVPTFEERLEIQRAIEAVVDSHESGRWVGIPKQ